MVMKAEEIMRLQRRATSCTTDRGVEVFQGEARRLNDRGVVFNPPWKDFLFFVYFFGPLGSHDGPGADSLLLRRTRVHDDKRYLSVGC
jgi:hypothetical protein